jgi:hypothetical protein
MFQSRKTLILLFLALGVWWGVAYFTAPPTGPVATYPDKHQGFVQFMASSDRVGYLLISEAPEREVSFSGESSWFLGINSKTIKIQTRQETREVDLGRVPKVIFIAADGTVTVQNSKISRRDLAGLENSFNASAGRAASVKLAKHLMRGING